MTKTQAESTQIALIGKDISQIQKDLASLAQKMEEIRSARYVTQNELTVSIAGSEKKQSEGLQSLKDDVSSIKKVLWAMGSTIILAFIGAVGRMVFNI